MNNEIKTINIDYNIVSCGMCTYTFLHIPSNADELKCSNCGFTSECCDFPDANAYLSKTPTSDISTEEIVSELEIEDIPSKLTIEDIGKVAHAIVDSIYMENDYSAIQESILEILDVENDEIANEECYPLRYIHADIQRLRKHEDEKVRKHKEELKFCKKCGSPHKRDKNTCEHCGRYDEITGEH